ncbi:hypothetical protein BAZOLSSOX_542 [uncultured Gammaproteobacteria bacterium]|nr:hypothetical protein BAZOLSSOX_542 [uncultured Gammaproteobacteria bacterium]
MIIHHHTGGLENTHHNEKSELEIHHHTGGLEKQGVDRMWTRKIHHHTGGLEMIKSCLRNPSLDSPPHRWLRKERK